MKKKQLKIAMLGQKSIPGRQGGVEIVVTELAVRMAKRGQQVTVYNRSGHHVSGREFDSKKIGKYQDVYLKYVPTIDVRGLAAMSSSFFAAVRAALGKYDVVHFHAEGPCAMLWIPKLTGKRCIATIHGLDHKRAKWGKFARAYIMFGEKCAVRFADEIIVLSEGMQQYFMDTYGRKTVWIPNGVNRPNVRKAKLIKDEFGLEKDSYILFLGRLVPEKGLCYLIEAFKQTETEKKLVIAGGSSDTDAFVAELRKMAGGDERIIFTGFVQGQELDELYSNAYVYTLPSDLEGMPLALLEALSYGNCCLVSDIEECASVAADRILTFKKSDTDDLREKLQMLCNQKETVAKMKEAAADFVCERYNWDEITEKILKLYRK